MHLFYCTTGEAIRAGDRLGVACAAAGLSPGPVRLGRLARLYWRLQPPHIRRAVAWGFTSGYRAAVTRRQPVQH